MPILSSLSIACARAFGFTSGDLFAGAALALDFDETTTLDSRITFTRATSATYFDSSGVLQTASSGVARFDHRLESSVWVNKGLLIEEQRTNLALRSEEFNDASWIKTNSSVTANTIAAPNGATTADKLVENTTNTQHFIHRSSTIAVSTNYTASVFVKAAERTRIRIVFLSLGGGGVFADVNLSTGTITAAQAFSGGTATASSITDVGGGWYRISVTGIPTSTSGELRLELLDASGQRTYAGTTGWGLHIWGAQLEAGTFPTSYIKTTTVSVTRNADVASMTGTDFSDWYNATEGTVYSLTDGADPNDANAFDTLFRWAISDDSNAERLQFSSATVTGVPRLAFSAIDNNINQANLTQVLGSWSTTKQYAGASAYKVDDFALSVDGATILTDTSGTLPTVDRLYLGANSTGVGFFLNGHIAKFYYWNTRKSNTFLQAITG